MLKVLSFDFPKLSLEDKLLFQRYLRARRAELLNSILAVAKSPESAEKFGAHFLVIKRFLSELIFISQKSPDDFWRLLDHWSTTFLLDQLFFDTKSYTPEQLHRLVNNLGALLLFDRLCRRDAPTTNAVYTITVDANGQIPGLSHNLVIQFQDPKWRQQTLEWHCTNKEVTVCRVGSDQTEFKLPLPVPTNDYFALRALAWGEVLNVPIFDEEAIIGKPDTRLESPYAFSQPEHNIDQWLRPNYTLKMAQDLLATEWPAVLDWVEMSVPAFVDMGVPLDNYTHYSGSHGPGTPIFLSQIDANDPLLHAEDLVHEVQHHRLFLFVEHSPFKCWNDLEQCYISPYRSDPRPLRGLIIGLHAFLTVNELRIKLLGEKTPPESHVFQMLNSHCQNLFTFRTLLEHEEFHNAGRQLFAEMGQVLVRQDALLQKMVTPEIQQRVDGLISHHAQRVQQQITGIKNVEAKYQDWKEIVQIAANFN
jgi:hypothetical protein